MPTSRIIQISLLLLAVTACRPDQKKPEAKLQDALPYLPLPPQAEFVSRSGSEDALQVVLNTPLSVDSTILMYHMVLSKAPWTLTADQPAADGGRTLLAINEGHPPLWIMIVPNPSGPGARVSINGAVMPKAPEPASRTPNMDSAKSQTAPATTRKPGN